MKTQISGIILTHNNERTIREAVASIAPLVAELVVVDDHSTDRTLEIVREVYPNVRVMTRKLERFDVQRNAGIEAASHEWVLMIDSDEVVRDDLARSITAVRENAGSAAYSCYRLNQAFDTYTKEKMIRPILFRRGMRFEGALHETIPNIPLSYLPGALIHRSWVSAEDWMDDMNHYSTHQARRWIMEGRRYSALQLFCIGLLMPGYQFVKMYLFQRRFKNGLFAGFLYSWCCSMEWTFIVLKYRELARQQDAVDTIKNAP